MVGASLFSSAGIAETYFEEAGINIVASNELVREMAVLYQALYPKSEMVAGNILDESLSSIRKCNKKTAFKPLWTFSLASRSFKSRMSMLS